MKFVADAMVGKLARWLRFLGIDVVYIPSGDVEKIVEIAENEGRIILTRNTDVLKKLRGHHVWIYFLSSEKSELQLKEVVEKFNLWKEINPFSRCSVCNVPLVPVEKEEVRGKVPFYVFQTVDHFEKCPQCGRIYWEGSHINRLKEKLSKILGREIK